MGVLGSAQEKVPVIIIFKERQDLNLVGNLGGQVNIVYRFQPAVAAVIPMQAVDALSRNPAVKYVVPDLPIEPVGETLPWGVDRIGAPAVHAAGNKGTGINVAVLDTGIDKDHPDLSYVYGYDFSGGNDPDPEDYNGHGTHVAGTIAALDNDIGVIGVAPEANLYILKIFMDDGRGYYSDAAEALEWCIGTYSDGIPGNEIQVISMSWGSNVEQGDPGIEDWINQAYDLGILLIGAAGNEGNSGGTGDNVIYPARYENVIAVAATDNTNARARWSSTGSAVELSAPGVGILSTYLHAGYTFMNGTSMACPHVSGTAALVFNSPVDPAYDLDGDRTWDASEVRKKLQDTADDLGNPGRDPLYGYGLVDANEAAAEADTTPPSIITDLTATAGAYPNIHLAWTAATDNVGVNHYNIYRSTTGTIDRETDLLATAPGTATSYTDSTGMAETTYYYAVCAVDAAGNEAELSNIASATVAAAPSYTLHVGSIDMSKQTLGRWRFSWTRAVAVVAILDAEGNPVEGAKVYGHWSGLASGKVYGVTGSNGQVTFKSRFVRSASGTFTFTVDNVIKDGWTYDSNANEETSDSITVP
jgi:subtilisin/minor extracellular protease Epr